MREQINRRGQNNRYDMNDRELRAYRRKLRRQRRIRRRVVTMLLTVCLVVLCVCSYHSLKSSANSGNEEIKFKYYTGVVVKYGDTLWSISDNYIDYDKYKDKKAYIKEVCSINNLESDDEIKVGQRIVVPYYSTEFVK